MTHRSPSGPHRRDFLKGAASLAAMPLIAPRWIHGSPIATLQVGCVGVGGMGASDLAAVATGESVNIASLCDVDANNLGAAAKLHDKAQTFADWRVMFDTMAKDLDAVVISTPDHMHAPIALAAMENGLHVYCQKPVAHNLRECRLMASAAEAAPKLVTQMGTQIHAHGAYRSAVATIRAGALGKVRAAHTWVNKGWVGPEGGVPDTVDPIPKSLHWNLWLGVAEERSYVKDVYHPARWRGLIDFGTGTLGDMGCHLFDPLFSALGLGAPKTAHYTGEPHNQGVFVGDEHVHYTFAGTDQTTDSFELTWTDGAAAPGKAGDLLPEGVQLPAGGSVIVGENAVMLLPHWAMPQVFVDGKRVDNTPDSPVVVVESIDHWHEWTDACRGIGASTTPFAYATAVTEAVLVGTVAGRVPGAKLTWNPDTMSLGEKTADRLIGRQYRKGWELG